MSGLWKKIQVELEKDKTFAKKNRITILVPTWRYQDSRPILINSKFLITTSASVIALTIYFTYLSGCR